MSPEEDEAKCFNKTKQNTKQNRGVLPICLLKAVLKGHRSEAAQKHFLKTIWGPNSSYSSWLIQAEEKDDMLARIAPPLHTEKSRSLGLVTFTLSPKPTGAKRLISHCRRSGSPVSRVFPPSETRRRTTISSRDLHSIRYTSNDQNIGFIQDFQKLYSYLRGRYFPPGPCAGRRPTEEQI